MNWRRPFPINEEPRPDPDDLPDELLQRCLSHAKKRECLSCGHRQWVYDRQGFNIRNECNKCGTVGIV